MVNLETNQAVEDKGSEELVLVPIPPPVGDRADNLGLVPQGSLVLVNTRHLVGV